jgi:hypothetical protein
MTVAQGFDGADDADGAGSDDGNVAACRSVHRRAFSVQGHAGPAHVSPQGGETAFKARFQPVQPPRDGPDLRSDLYSDANAFCKPVSCRFAAGNWAFASANGQMAGGVKCHLAFCPGCKIVRKPI